MITKIKNLFTMIIQGIDNLVEKQHEVFSRSPTENFKRKLEINEKILMGEHNLDDLIEAEILKKK